MDSTLSHLKDAIVEAAIEDDFIAVVAIANAAYKVQTGGRPMPSPITSTSLLLRGTGGRPRDDANLIFVGPSGNWYCPGYERTVYTGARGNNSWVRLILAGFLEEARALGRETFSRREVDQWILNNVSLEEEEKEPKADGTPVYAYCISNALRWIADRHDEGYQLGIRRVFPGADYYEIVDSVEVLQDAMVAA